MKNPVSEARNFLGAAVLVTTLPAAGIYTLIKKSLFTASRPKQNQKSDGSCSKGIKLVPPHD